MQNLPDLELAAAPEIVAWLLEQFPGKVALACSFQKEETVLLDMLLAAMNTPEMKAKFDQQGLFADGTCGAKFGTFLRNITADYEKIITAAGIKPN